MGVDLFRTTIATLLVGLNGSGVAELLLPANSTGGAHTKPLGRLSARHTGCNRIHNALAKIESKSFSHPCWPSSPAWRLNQFDTDLKTLI